MVKAPAAPDKLEEKESSLSANIESRKIVDKGVSSTSSRDQLTFSANIAKKKSVPVAVNPGISQLKEGAAFLKEALKVGIDTLILKDDEAAQLMASLIDTDQKLAKLIASASIKTSKKDKSSKDSKVNLIDEMIYFGDLSFSLRQFFRQILDYGVKQVVVTLGSKGVCVATSEQLYFHDTPKGIKVVNTLGAGDAFGSAFTRALYTHCLLYTSPSQRDRTRSRMPSSA